MKHWSKNLVLALATALAPAGVAQALVLDLTAISTAFSTPIGIDYHEPTDSVAVTSNYPSGIPFNFELIDEDGIHTAYSTESGLTDEIKIATVRSPARGGFDGGAGYFAPGTTTVYTGIGVSIEDIDLIPENENFFGVNFGTSSLLGAEADQWDGVVGQILLTQEFHPGSSGLFLLTWDGGAPSTELITIGAGSAPVGQWEHVTFAPAGILEIPPVPEPGTILLLSLGLLALGYLVSRAS